MTTFEITIITLLALIAFALIFRDFVIGRALDQIIHNQDAMQQDIQRIEVNTHHASGVLQDHIAPDVEIIGNNFLHLLNEGEPLDAAFEPDYRLKKDIECKLNGFAAAVLDAECCPKEIVDFWLERICDAAHKYIKQLKIDWDKLSKEQQDEFLKRLIMPNYDSTFQPPFNPTCEITNNKE